ncbi:hypothetical protein FGO68_gene9183 [Halteria grandinella]|uniref:Uncharacterized protein n=1 Tax=Halteria grandinella TaxID=5974 RepID=A0A8J8NF41_HALGN|nr:hypothetical protein FGO68_gene9183 [Halteria grandinella]
MSQSPSQTFSTLYLYNFKKLTPTSTGYQSAKVNGDTYLMDLIELDSSEFVGTFKLVKNATFGGKIKIADIKTIELSIEVPPAPAEQ